MSILHSDFNSAYELMFSAWGEGELREDDLIPSQRPDCVIEQFEKKFKRFPGSISLEIEDPRSAGCDYGFTGVDTDLLEKLETLKELILPKTIKQLRMTPKLRAILHDNNTLIRGEFDSFAEKLAASEGLHFRPSDFIFARAYFEPAMERSFLKLIFRRDGSVTVCEEVNSPGSSAGNSFGGTWYHDLPSDFFLKQTAEEIAGRFRNSLCSSVIESGKLASFIKKAKKRGYYTGAN